jgi:UDP-glucose 4-epimerase
MVIPRFVQAAIENAPIQVFGDGSQSRVFCHVSDAVQALLSLISRVDSYGEVFNIGGKGEITILELANLVIKKSKSSSIIVFKEYGDAYTTGYEDMFRRVPDISKINEFTGWNPKLNIQDTVEDIVESFIKEI